MQPLRSALVAVLACVAVASGMTAPIAASATPAPASGADRDVTLVTGDVVHVSTGPDGRQVATVTPADANKETGPYQTFNLGSDLYVVPQSAMAEIGGAMSLAAFDVTNPPGSTPPVSVPQAASVMRTLTINGIDAAGQPASGNSTVLYSVDDMTQYRGAFQVMQGGMAKFSVPSGRYVAISSFYDPTTRTAREVVAPQFLVTGDTAITLDARTATSPVSVSTPQPATQAASEIGFGRTDKKGNLGTFTFLGNSTTKYLVTPTGKKVTAGLLHYFYFTRMSGPSYTYNLEFPSEGRISADQHYTVPGSGLATVDSSYPASHTDTTSLIGAWAALPWQRTLVGSYTPFTTPTRRTEYFTPRPDLFWQSAYYAVGSTPLRGQYVGAWRTYTPGTRDAATWGGAAGHPRLLERGIFVNQTVCAACLSGRRLDLLAYPFGDNSPEHFGFSSSQPGESTAYRVFADNTLLKSGGFLQANNITLPGDAQTYRIDYDTVRSSPDFTLSTDTRTRWTVPASAPLGGLPSGWVCALAAANPPATCGVLPLVTSGYDLPVDLQGRLPAGATSATMSLGHLGGQGAAFTSVSVQVSYDGGQTWQDVAVTGHGDGGYTLGFSVPGGSTGGFGALKVSVRDASGGTFDQTIQHAFAIGS